MDEDISSVTTQLQDLLVKINRQQDANGRANAETLVKFQALNAALLNSYFQIRQLLNNSTPINSLPNEILCEVFALAARDPDETILSTVYLETSIVSSKNLEVIATVCRTWRDVILSTALLWSDFVMHKDWNERAYLRQLHLSRTAPANLFIAEESTRGAAGRLLTDLNSRLRDIIIVDCNQSKYILPFLPKTSNLLRKVSIYVAGDYLKPVENTYLSGLLSNMRFLDLFDLPYLPTGYFPNLTSLFVDGAECIYGLREILALFENAPRLEIMLLSITIESDVWATRSMIHLPCLRRCTLLTFAHSDILSWVTFPPTCLVLLGCHPSDYIMSGNGQNKLMYTKNLVSMLPHCPFVRHLTRFRIMPDHEGWEGPRINPDSYHLEFVDEQGTSGVHLEVWHDENLNAAHVRKSSAKELAKIFSSPAGAALVANIKEMWVYAWTDLLSPSLLACFPSLEAINLVLDEEQGPMQPIPSSLRRARDGKARLTTVCLFACGVDTVEVMQDILRERKREGRPVRQLAIECMDFEVHAEALKLHKYVHQLVATIADESMEWWEDHAVPKNWHGYLCEWPEWPEWIKWRA